MYVCVCMCLSENITQIKCHAHKKTCKILPDMLAFSLHDILSIIFAWLLRYVL